MARHLNLALLICDTRPPPAVGETREYLEIFEPYLQKSLDNILNTTQQAAGSVEFTLDGYDVVRGIYPDDAKLSEYDGVIVPGSAASVYDPLPWIPPLLDFVARVARDFSRTKILGICFGHQIVTTALGGNCVPNEKGWEVGVFDVQLNSLGAEVFGRNDLKIHQTHRDHVPATSIPPNCELIGATPTCANQGMVCRYPRSISADGLRGIHILTVQGHPEFDENITSKIIDSMELSGVMAPSVIADGRERARREHDGINVVGRVMWGVLGVS